MSELQVRRATADDAVEQGSTSCYESAIRHIPKISDFRGPRSQAHDDAEGLVAVYRSAYRENRRLGFPAKAESATQREVSEWIREHRVFVAEIEKEEDEAEIVGGVRLEVTDPERVKLSRLGVHENWKGRGVGSRLLDRAEEAVRDWGYETVWLTTPEEHPYLPDVYRRRGYEQTGTYPLEYRQYDEIVMEKRLR